MLPMMYIRCYDHQDKEKRVGRDQWIGNLKRLD